MISVSTAAMKMLAKGTAKSSGAIVSVDQVMWCRQQSVNHQGLLYDLHCATTVVLRE